MRSSPDSIPSEGLEIEEIAHRDWGTKKVAAFVICSCYKIASPPVRRAVSGPRATCFFKNKGSRFRGEVCLLSAANLFPARGHYASHQTISQTRGQAAHRQAYYRETKHSSTSCRQDSARPTSWRKINSQAIRRQASQRQAMHQGTDDRGHSGGRAQAGPCAQQQRVETAERYYCLPGGAAFWDLSRRGMRRRTEAKPAWSESRSSHPAGGLGKGGTQDWQGTLKQRI